MSFALRHCTVSQQMHARDLLSSARVQVSNQILPEPVAGEAVIGVAVAALGSACGRQRGGHEPSAGCPGDPSMASRRHSAASRHRARKGVVLAMRGS